MKKYFLFLILFIASYSYSQSVNDYKGVIIPMKYDFLKTENQYRLQTITKLDLQKAGFQAFYATETIPAEFTDRCSLLYVEVKKENAFLVSKLYIVLKDCYSAIIFQSVIGKSREKEFETAYVDALNQAFISVYALNYKYNGNTNFSPKTGINTQSVPVAVTPTTSAPVMVAVPVVAVSVAKNEPKITESTSSNTLYAQPTPYGYQLIDSEPKVVMKVYKTSNPASFMATKESLQGVLVSKDNQWFFEYYQNDKLISEKIDVKF
ncbi:hypothetical protein [Flavobacterium sp.]|uniref:hypothetical protein n=1 Tax=Flavobacterium sp. TaxID=239 RepID=UPI003752BE27